MYVNGSQIAGLVGQKGANISRIEGDSGASIQIETDGLIAMDGSEEQVEAARYNYCYCCCYLYCYCCCCCCCC